MLFRSDSGSKQYLNLVPKFPGVKFKEMFPSSTEAELDLLEKMLKFNPFMRITAKEALEHPYFKDIRHEELEKEGTPIILCTNSPDSTSIQNLKRFCVLFKGKKNVDNSIHLNKKPEVMGTNENAATDWCRSGDRKSVAEGKRGFAGVDLGGRRLIKLKTT